MPQDILLAYAAVFGLCMGSFANVLIYRLPRGESIAAPPSHCPACGARLRAMDLLPVLSYLLLRGRCRYCDARVALRYPLVESACALLFVGMTAYAPAWDAVPLCMLAFVLFTLSVIDGETQEIPDGLLITGAAAAVLWIGADALLPGLGLDAPGLPAALLGALAGGLPLFLLDRLVRLAVQKDGFGFGDVKLMAMAGLFLGWPLTFTAFFFAFLTGGTYAAFLLFTRRAQRDAYMPFGPFLSGGVLAALWWGERAIGLLFGAYLHQPQQVLPFAGGHGALGPVWHDERLLALVQILFADFR